MSDQFLPLLVEPEQLETLLGDQRLVLVHISKPERYAQFHIPGAVFVEGAGYVRVEKPVAGLLPEAGHFGQLLVSLGISRHSHVVCYDDEGGGWASRFLWTLDVAGHDDFSLLNGGLIAWVNEGFPISQQAEAPAAGNYNNPTWRQEPVADTEYIRSRLGDPDLGLLDARTPQEFSGEKRFAEHGGHIPGASLLNWTDTMDQNRNLRLKPAEQLNAMLEQRRLSSDKEIICYCQTHHRSSLAYIMLKSLGYPRVKGYPGSWSAWGNRSDTPKEV